MLGELCERTGLPPNFIEMMSRDERAQVSHPQVSLRMLPALIRLTRIAWRHGRAAEQIWAFLAEHEQFLSEYQTAEWSEARIPDLHSALDRLIVHHTHLFWHTFLGQMAMMIRMQILANWIKRRTRGVAPGDLVRGLVGLKALGPNAKLRRLAGVARDLDPGLLAALAARQQMPPVIYWRPRS